MKKDITELCDFGQGKCVVYSESENVFNLFSQDTRCLKADVYRRNGKWIASDCYFDKKYKDSLERRLKTLGVKAM